MMKGADAMYNELYGSKYLTDATTKTTLKNAHDTLSSKSVELLNAVNTAAQDDYITDAERTSVQSLYATYKTYLKSFYDACDSAYSKVTASISSELATLNSALDAAKKDFNDGQEALQSNIDTLEVGSVKEKQKQDFINATIQAQKEIFDAQEDLKKAQDKNYSKKTFDSNGVSVDTSAYDNLIRLTKQSQTLEQLKAEKEAMNEYLREYGTFQQKRAAIKEQFEQKINEATTEGAKMSLRKQMQEALNEINLEELKDQLDWGVVFGDISKVTKKELQEVKKQLIAFKKSDAYKKQTPEQIKIIEEALNEINDNLAERGGLFGGLIESLDNYKVTVEELKKAQEEYEKAVTDSEKAEKKKALQQAKQNAKDAKTTRDKSIDSTINKLEELDRHDLPRISLE